MTFPPHERSEHAANLSAYAALADAAMVHRRHEAVVTDGELLIALRRVAYLASVAATEMRILVGLLRARRVTWQEIGLSLGVTRSAAQQRYR